MPKRRQPIEKVLALLLKADQQNRMQKAAQGTLAAQDKYHYILAKTIICTKSKLSSKANYTLAIILHHSGTVHTWPERKDWLNVLQLKATLKRSGYVLQFLIVGVLCKINLNDTVRSLREIKRTASYGSRQSTIPALMQSVSG